MRIDILGYLGRVQRGEIGIPMALLPFLLGYAWVWLWWRLLPGFRRAGKLGAIAIGTMAAVLGLMLTSVAYDCPSCMPRQAGCAVEVRGWPARQQVADVDPKPVVFYDVCRLAEWESNAAWTVNYSLGAFVVPLLIALAMSWRGHRGG